MRFLAIFYFLLKGTILLKGTWKSKILAIFEYFYLWLFLVSEHLATLVLYNRLGYSYYVWPIRTKYSLVIFLLRFISILNNLAPCKTIFLHLKITNYKFINLSLDSIKYKKSKQYCVDIRRHIVFNSDLESKNFNALVSL